MSTYQQVIAAVVVLLISVLGSGCGGQDGDQALAEKAVLRSSDLPSAGEGLSWYADAPDEETVVNRCATFDVPGLVVTALAHSDWYASSRLGEVTSLAGVYRDSANQALEKVADQVTTCMREERASGTGIFGASVGEVNVQEISFPGVGTSSRAYEITSGFGPLTVYEDVVLIRKDRSLALLYFSPEFGCSGRFCGRTKRAVASSRRLLAEMAKRIASRM
jgi:hypothetical protein